VLPESFRRGVSLAFGPELADHCLDAGPYRVRGEL
jgi:hypothetical protein